MRKLFGIALLSVFVLAACGESDDRTVVCTIEEMGLEGTITAEVEDGQIVEVVMDILGTTVTFSDDQIEAEGLSRNVDAFIRDMESEGAECTY